jgi:hypothetical protein
VGLFPAQNRTLPTENQAVNLAIYKMNGLMNSIGGVNEVIFRKIQVGICPTFDV